MAKVEGISISTRAPTPGMLKPKSSLVCTCNPPPPPPPPPLKPPLKLLLLLLLMLLLLMLLFVDWYMDVIEGAATVERASLPSSSARASPNAAATKPLNSAI